MNEEFHNIFVENFLKNYDAAEKKKILLSREDQVLIEMKDKKLEIIRNFLSEFVKQGVQVRHKDFYNNTIVDKSLAQDQRFNFYNSETSQSWAPGVSIMFDHPAEVEIAIPNERQEGVVIIKVATYHPSSRLLERKINSYEDACKALAAFLSTSVVCVDEEYKKILVEYERKTKTNNSATNVSTGVSMSDEKRTNLKAFTQNVDKKNNNHIISKMPFPDKNEKEPQ